MSVLVSGRIGLSLIPDQMTVQRVCAMGVRFGQPLDASSAVFTLYNCPGMHNVDIDAVFRCVVERQLRTILKPSDAMFSLSHVYLHQERYVLWHVGVSEWAKDCHRLALETLSPFVSESQRLYETDAAQQENPAIKSRELDLVKKYGRRYVDWRDQPHFMCGLASEGGAETLQSLKKRDRRVNHRGCFTHLALTVHGGAGKIEQILAQVPIISVS